MSSVLETPPGWWGIVLVGLMLPKDHPEIQVRAHKKDVPDNWRGQRVGKGKMPATWFDNAIRAGQREFTDLYRCPPGTLPAAESIRRVQAIERERGLALWMASFEEVPVLVRKTGVRPVRELLASIRSLGVEPEVWEYDDEHLDRVRVPVTDKVAA